MKKDYEKEDEFLNIWKREILKFSKANKLKVKKGTSKHLSFSRVAYFVTECFFGAANTFSKKHPTTGKINSQRNVEYLESQIYTFAKKNSLICNQLPHEKPLKVRQPNRKLVPWSVIGFKVVEVDNYIEGFLMKVFNIEEEK